MFPLYGRVTLTPTPSMLWRISIRRRHASRNTRHRTPTFVPPPPRRISYDGHRPKSAGSTLQVVAVAVVVLHCRGSDIDNAPEAPAVETPDYFPL
jgi:hypothetical protein